MLLICVSTCFAAVYAHYTEITLPFPIMDRIYIQFIVLISSLAGAISVASVIRNNHGAVYKALILGLLISLLFVFLQILIAETQVIAVDQNRLHGLNGEPKGLALYLVPFIIAFFFVPILKTKLKFFLIIFLITVLIFTLSTTGFVSLSICFFISYILFGKTNRFKILLWISILIAATFITIQSSDELTSVIWDRFSARLAGFVDESIQTTFNIPFWGTIGVDANDAPALYWILDNPFVILFGSGYGFDTIFSYKYFNYYQKIGFLNPNYSGYLTPNLAIITNLLNYGILVLLIMTLPILQRTPYYYNSPNRTIKEKFLLVYFTANYISSLVVRPSPLTLMFYWVILLILLPRQIKVSE
jgi:hypothetical protein